MERDNANLAAEEHVPIAAEMYGRWGRGESKSSLEAEYWGSSSAHGKKFTAYVKKWLDFDTETKSPQSKQISLLRARVEELESQLRDPERQSAADRDSAGERPILANARESALAALRIYNDPVAGYRTEAFILLMVTAWNSLLQAILERAGVDYYERDSNGGQVLIDGQPKVLGTPQLIGKALADDENRAVRENLGFFMKLRNQVAHRHLPELDTEICGEAQALLLNFEERLLAEFGEQATLGDQLTVPLQLSGFRSDGPLSSLRRAQARLPVDVSEFLSAHRANIDDDVLASPDYCLQIFFIPVAANRERSADAVVRFVRPEEVTPELASGLQSLSVVPKPRITPVASADLLRVGEVVDFVAERLPWRFTQHAHTKCWKHFGVRPPARSPDQTATDDRYCRWDRLFRGYGYTSAWAKKLLRHLSDSDTYEEILGKPPAP